MLPLQYFPEPQCESDVHETQVPPLLPMLILQTSPLGQFEFDVHSKHSLYDP